MTSIFHFLKLSNYQSTYLLKHIWWISQPSSKNSLVHWLNYSFSWSLNVTHLFYKDTLIAKITKRAQKAPPSTKKKEALSRMLCNSNYTCEKWTKLRSGGELSSKIICIIIYVSFLGCTKLYHFFLKRQMLQIFIEMAFFFF